MTDLPAVVTRLRCGACRTALRPLSSWCDRCKASVTSATVASLQCSACGRVLRPTHNGSGPTWALCECTAPPFRFRLRDTVLVGCVRCGARAPARHYTDLATFVCTCGGDIVPVAGPVQERAT